MTGKPIVEGVMLLVIVLFVATQCSSFSNADISIPTILIAVLVILVWIAGRRHAST